MIWERQEAPRSSCGSRVWYLVALLLLGVWLATAPATGRASENDPAVLGLWLTEKKKVLVDFYPCASDVCGRIVWLGKPYRKSGELRRDTHNPDPSLRNRALCGIQVVKGLKADGDGFWEDGKFYNPKDGSSYGLDLGPVQGDTMKARGYLGIRLLGKTETWTRPGPEVSPGCVPES